ncbi:MAG: Na+/H+ antiporter NhaA, partial [Desulfomonilia bacterium]|nr:Na+/H+ antiporter NhaA [Desulfomonilia bacterium]
FGFYEALDFTPIRLAEGQKVAMVRCYMAHHQGMFLVALAIVDDLGAVLVIAIFYTSSVDILALGTGALIFLVLIGFNLSGIRIGLPYFIVGLVLWGVLLHSGIHATVAGILVAWCVPARPRFTPLHFSHQMHGLLERFNAQPDIYHGHHTDQQQNALLHAMQRTIHLVLAPLQRMEDALHLPVALLIVPAFALANAGIPLDRDSLGQALHHPVTQGITLGLVAGKFLGIFCFTWLAVKIGIASLPEGVGMRHIAGVGMLCGIGFTMSIFISELSFPGQPDILAMAKTGIFAASLLAGICGFLFLWVLGKTGSQ